MLDFFYRSNFSEGASALFVPLGLYLLLLIIDIVFMVLLPSYMGVHISHLNGEQDKERQFG